MSLNDIELTTLDGKPTTFGAYSDKVVLVVNVASRCGLSPQYQQLEELQKKYGSRGFTVVGVPSNQFLQELKNSDDIAEYCSTTWGVTFPMMSKISVKGKDMHPVYQFLTEKSKNGLEDNKVEWNFQKYLIDEKGHLVRVVSPRILPNDQSIVAWIEK
mgnify:CR=1 FL=1